ncbi:hypothetical protein AAFF_G00208920 [Aldrovandia affinis]|uniref:Uncharacterized protein n=1 Tax=Aldrovandia affinis TaxID=143900 RepID=A0AAD7W4M6_9TELE|nr:hypothetical protein AAFF_G00208920 [Aldrovandia affinis]
MDSAESGGERVRSPAWEHLSGSRCCLDGLERGELASHAHRAKPPSAAPGLQIARHGILSALSSDSDTFQSRRLLTPSIPSQIARTETDRTAGASASCLTGISGL